MKLKKNHQLRTAIIDAGITQVELSKVTGISRGYISLALAGRYNMDRAEKQKVAEALGRQPDELFHTCGDKE